MAEHRLTLTDITHQIEIVDRPPLTLEQQRRVHQLARQWARETEARLMATIIGYHAPPPEVLMLGVERPMGGIFNLNTNLT